MSDLIKRSDAIEAYADIYWIDDRLNLAYREELDQIDEKIRNIPTVEVADRPQGEWQEKEVFGEYNDDVHHYVSEWQSARCSVCGKYHTTPYAYYFNEYNFCPSCGARMKGADDVG